MGTVDADGLLCSKESCLLEDGALMRYDTLNKRVEKEQKLGVRKLVYFVFTSRKDQGMRTLGMTSKVTRRGQGSD